MGTKNNTNERDLALVQFLLSNHLCDVYTMAQILTAKVGPETTLPTLAQRPAKPDLVPTLRVFTSLAHRQEVHRPLTSGLG